MKLGNLIAALNQAKEQNPHFDFNGFELLINGSPIAKMGADTKAFTIRLETEAVNVPEKADAVPEEVDVD